MQRLTTLRARRRFNRCPHFAGAFWLQRVCPTVRLVQKIAQAGKGVLMPWRRDVQCLPGAELKAWGAEVQLDIAFVRVAHPKAVVLIPVQPSKGQSLKSLNGLLLGVGTGIIALGKADDACRVAPLVGARIDQVTGLVGGAVQHLGQRVADLGLRLAGVVADQIAVLVIGQNFTRCQVVYGSCTATSAGGEERDDHSPPPVCAATICAICRSMTTSCVATLSASIWLARPDLTAPLIQRES